MTPEQLTLAAEHGTPRQFQGAMRWAVGRYYVAPWDAVAAVYDYINHWQVAGRSRPSLPVACPPAPVPRLGEDAEQVLCGEGMG